MQSSSNIQLPIASRAVTDYRAIPRSPNSTRTKYELAFTGAETAILLRRGKPFTPGTPPPPQYTLDWTRTWDATKRAWSTFNIRISDVTRAKNYYLSLLTIYTLYRSL